MDRVRTGLRIPYEKNTELILMARKQGISKNALILQAIKEYLKQEGEEKNGKGNTSIGDSSCDFISDSSAKA